MHLKKIIIGELVVLIASVFIYRSIWVLMDEYFGNSYLLVFLITGLILVVLGLMLLNYEINRAVKKDHKSDSSNS